MTKTKGKKSWYFIPVRGGLQAKVDAEDYERVMEHNWYKTTSKSGRMSVITNLKTPKGFRLTTLGKFLMRPPLGKFVYPRRFMEGFDYRKENLVICTMAERQQMLPKSRKHGSSMFKGVSYSSRRGLWQAGLQHKGKTVNLGLYKSEIAAAEAYNVAAKKFYGEFAYFNQVDRADNRRGSDRQKTAKRSPKKK